MSSLRFLNDTSYIAQFVVTKGDLMLARLPGIAPGAQIQVPCEDIYEVSAQVVVDGNTFTSAPASVTGPTSFLAQVKQNRAQGTYEFEMKVVDSSAADQMLFQKTTIAPVTFTISRNGKPLQNVVVQDSFLAKTLRINSIYSVYAVINGVTTDTLQTNNPNAVITAISDNSDLEAGYFTLSVA